MAVDLAGNQSTIESEQYTIRENYLIEIQPPLGKKKIFKQGSSIPIKFKLLNSAEGIISSDSKFRLFITKVTNGEFGEEMEATSVSKANEGNLFRYDDSEGQFIFNLNTKVLTKGTWQLRIKLDNYNIEYLTIKLR